MFVLEVDVVEVRHTWDDLGVGYLLNVCVPFYFLCWVLQALYELVHFKRLWESSLTTHQKIAVAGIRFFYLEKAVACFYLFLPLSGKLRVLLVVAGFMVNVRVDVLYDSIFREHQSLLLFFGRNEPLEFRYFFVTPIPSQDESFHVIIILARTILDLTLCLLFLDEWLCLMDDSYKIVKRREELLDRHLAIIVLVNSLQDTLPFFVV